MKKLSLSLGLILTFAFYTLFSSSKSISLSLPAGQQSAQAPANQQPQNQVKTPPPVILGDDYGEEDGIPARRISGTQTGSSGTPSATSRSAADTGNQTNVQTQPGGMMSGGAGSMMGQYKNGSYTGNVADAYYGNVQVKAVISGGKISDVQFLQHPSDRGTSIEINNYAMPILTQEAVQVQNSNVDIVSGATETSLAFRDSLSSALAQAK